MSQPMVIELRGVRTHNLKNIDLDLPKMQLVVVTGVSGSGKSSLVYHTLYAEGQRRYAESLSTYARQFLNMMDKPDLDSIQGLSPSIAIDQKSSNHNPRSTVGTITEIYDYLRVLFARVGDAHCPNHEVLLKAHSVSEIVTTLLNQFAQQKIYILACIPECKNLQGTLTKYLARGYVRFRIQGQIVEVHNPDEYSNISNYSDLAVVIDRLTINEEHKQRLIDSIENCLAITEYKVTVFQPKDHGDTHYVTQAVCPYCDFRVNELEPKNFSFNSPYGACSSCHGLGEVEHFDSHKMIDDPKLSLQGSAIKGWGPTNPQQYATLASLAKQCDFSLNIPWHALTVETQNLILYGPNKPLKIYNSHSKKEQYFIGIIPKMEELYQESTSLNVREQLALFRTVGVCQQCQGTRLGPVARHVYLGEHSISKLSDMSLQDCHIFFDKLTLPGSKALIGQTVVREIVTRLKFLNAVGLGYLSLHRKANTLSGGEAQRIRLASQIGSGLTGVLYVLDEPSIGLHQRDNDKLIQILKDLRDLGNSVFVIEHDLDMICSADYCVDIGPGAGLQGGRVMALGTPAELAQNPNSMTGAYLAKQKMIAIPRHLRQFRSNPKHPFKSLRNSQSSDHEFQVLHLTGAKGHNLQNVSVEIPVGMFVCVTGVSGSGKSTLINHTLALAAAGNLQNAHAAPLSYDHLTGLEWFDKVIQINQSPIGRTPRSNPATYTDIMKHIRDLFAQTEQARERGYQPGRFSFNVAGGRCEACQGEGLIKVEMHYMSDVYIKCEVCQGTRYNAETLQVQFKHLNISQVLDLTVDEAFHFFQAVPILKRKIKTLVDVGMGYVKLGQSATTLSGGEAQRVKLALELSKPDTGRTLYFLDEPTTGLHFYDIDLLLKILHRLVDNGNTVVVIEHNLDVIKTADWIIDMGPEGGSGGGKVLFCGRPRDLTLCQESYTGKYLKPLFAEETSPIVQGI
ncbi:MAG: excinuclease ABC subunit UvrA [Gammaproteobacteria bacterium]|nr:excinuclease ABC subunit UvrA [Gammaproteobacteria bacterium]